ncbi:MAG: WhiB family transcriptional regulator [Actinobacteria bacterium]|nr:WhiB family transcriptional regulator [Actinomycetota bacterium]
MSDLSWMDLGRCTEIDGELWYPPKGASTREAKLVCLGCEVRARCLDYALENEIKHGIWGGLSEHQRRPLRRERAA